MFARRAVVAVLCMLSVVGAVPVARAAMSLGGVTAYSADDLGDIARAAGLTAPSLYNYFEGKQALYEAVIARGVQRVNREIPEQRGSLSPARRDPRQRLARGVERPLHAEHGGGLLD